MSEAPTKIITLICERAADLKEHCDSDGRLKDDPNVSVVRYPCSGMIQPLQIEAALKAGASGVVVCGCQIGDCYYREGNKMIRERLLGERPPGLKKAVDRRRVLALWLSRPQSQRFMAETKEFVARMRELDKAEPAAAPQAKPAPAPAPKKEEAVAEPASPEKPAKPESKPEKKSES